MATRIDYDFYRRRATQIRLASYRHAFQAVIFWSRRLWTVRFGHGTATQHH